MRSLNRLVHHAIVAWIFLYNLYSNFSDAYSLNKFLELRRVRKHLENSFGCPSFFFTCSIDFLSKFTITWCHYKQEFLFNILFLPPLLPYVVTAALLRPGGGFLLLPCDYAVFNCLWDLLGLIAMSASLMLAVNC